MKRPSLWRSFGHAFVGIATAFRRERNFRLHVMAMIVVIGLGITLRVDLFRWAILALAIGVVTAAEMFNTAIEAIVDLVSPEYHAAAKAAKDVSAGAVLIAAATAAIVGMCVLGPKLWTRLF